MKKTGIVWKDLRNDEIAVENRLFYRLNFWAIIPAVGE